jgi:hypothetical protein
MLSRTTSQFNPLDRELDASSTCERDTTSFSLEGTIMKFALDDDDQFRLDSGDRSP